MHRFLDLGDLCLDLQDALVRQELELLLLQVASNLASWEFVVLKFWMGYPSLSKASPVALMAPSAPKTFAAGFSFAEGLDANVEYALTAIEDKSRGGSGGCEWGMVDEP